MLHVGIDTVELAGKGYHIFVKEGQEIKQGEPILNVDLEEIKESGYSTETVMLITNTASYLNVIVEADRMIKAGERILTVIPYANEVGNEPLKGIKESWN